jgi:hypothetical protein
MVRLAAELETARRARRAFDDAVERARMVEAQACAAAEAWQTGVERMRLALVRGQWRREIGL